MTADRPAPQRRRRILFRVVVLLLIYPLTEVCCGVVLWGAKQVKGIRYKPVLNDLTAAQRERLTKLVEGRTRYVVFDRELGWSIRPNGASEDGLYQANLQGFRADREYGAKPPPGHVRFACFGDSFTHCDDVGNTDTWESALEAADEDFEVLNLGVPGYGLDQALLRYRKLGPALEPDVVLIGFLSENIFRCVNSFRPFYLPRSLLTLGKPRFELAAAGLELVPNPFQSLDDYARLLEHPESELTRLAALDPFGQRKARESWADASPAIRLLKTLAYERNEQGIHRDGVYDAEGQAFEVVLRLFETFRREVLAAGAVPIVVLFPERSDLTRRRAGKPMAYAPLVERLTQRGTPHVDLARAFPASADPDALYRAAHFVPAANAAIADTLHAYLRAHGLTTAKGVAQALAQARE